LPPALAEVDAGAFGVLEVFGALAALLAQDARSNAAALAKPIATTRPRDSWLI
jgi:hypothetical protein